MNEAPAYDTLRYELSDGIVTLTLDRPAQLNAFTTTMARELVHAFERISCDDEVAVVIVTGAGRAFCAGMDLSGADSPFGLDERLRPDLRDVKERYEDPEIAEGVRDSGGRVTLAIYDCLKPVIAAINGPAVGIGATMTLAMDARLISTDGRFGFVFGRLGITAEACSTWFLPRIVGLSAALELAYAADVLGADEALGIGLVRSVHQPGDLMTAAVSLAERFTAGKSQVATALMRQMFYRNSAERHPRDAHLVESLAMFYSSIGDGREGVAAFREKRPPVFRSHLSSGRPDFLPWQP